MAKPTVFSAIKEGWYAEDWHAARDEMAAILEYDQGNDRKRAFELATAETYKRYGSCPPTVGPPRTD
jgi:hypothetical protein